MRNNSNFSAVSFSSPRAVNKLPFGSRASLVETQILVARRYGHAFIGVRVPLRDDLGRLNRTRGGRFRQRRTIARRISLAVGSGPAGTHAMRAALSHSSLYSFSPFDTFEGFSVTSRRANKVRAPVCTFYRTTRYIYTYVCYWFVFFFLPSWFYITHCDFAKLFTLFLRHETVQLTDQRITLESVLRLVDIIDDKAARDFTGRWLNIGDRTAEHWHFNLNYVREVTRSRYKERPLKRRVRETRGNIHRVISLCGKRARGKKNYLPSIIAEKNRERLATGSFLFIHILKNSTFHRAPVFQKI